MKHDTTGLTRRQFLKSTGSVAAVAALGGRAFADDKPKLILGSGAHKYECVHDWLVPPTELKWGETQGVTQDSRGNIYVTHTVHATSESKDAIVVFDRHGKFLRSFGSRFVGGGHGVEVRKEGSQEFLYHCDTGHRKVVKTDLFGTTIWEKGRPMEVDHYRNDPKAPFIPTNIAFSPNGDFYVADGYGSDYIMQYDVKGDFIRAFGGRGTGEGQFVTAHGIYVDERFNEPMLLVTERGSSRNQYLTMEGKHIRWVTDGQRLPCYFDAYHDLLVVADLKGVVTLMDKDHKVVEMLGDGAKDPDFRGHPRSEFIPGHFIHPHGAKFLQNGDLVVAEWMPDGRITLLRKVKA